MKRELDFYFSGGHWERPLTPLETRRLAETAARLPTDFSTILDVGCGDGRLARSLSAATSGKVWGCDGSEAGLRRAGVPAVRCDVGRLPFPDRSFDAVSCCEVIEHLPPDVLRQTVSELKRVARRWIYVTVPNDEDLALYRARCRACGHRFHLHGHLGSFDVERLRGLFPDWRVDGSGVFCGNVRRNYSPWLLRIKQSIFDCWAWSDGLSCPECTEPMPGRERPLARAAIGLANRLLNPRRTKGGWAWIRLCR